MSVSRVESTRHVAEQCSKIGAGAVAAQKLRTALLSRAPAAMSRLRAAAAAVRELLPGKPIDLASELTVATNMQRGLRAACEDDREDTDAAGPKKSKTASKKCRTLSRLA